VGSFNWPLRETANQIYDKVAFAGAALIFAECIDTYIFIIFEIACRSGWQGFELATAGNVSSHEFFA